MPLFELEKAGLEALMKAEVDEIIDKVKDKQKYMDSLEPVEPSHYEIHYSQLRHLEGVANGMTQTLSAMQAHL